MENHFKLFPEVDTSCVFQVTKEQPGREMETFIWGLPSHPATNSFSEKDLWIIHGPELQTDSWLDLAGCYSQRTNNGVWCLGCAASEQAKASKLQPLAMQCFHPTRYSGSDSLSFENMFWQPHVDSPGLLSKQQKPREVSEVRQLHRQVSSFYPFGPTTGYFGTWLPADTWK